MVDQRLADRTGDYPPAVLEGSLVDGRKEVRYRDLAFLDRLLPPMLEKARSLTEVEKPRRIQESLGEMRATLEVEVSRLRSLAEVNDHVDRKEIAAVEARMARIEQAMAKAELRLDSLRLIWLGLEPGRR
jgi:ATP-dependent helicase HepA